MELEKRNPKRPIRSYMCSSGSKDIFKKPASGSINCSKSIPYQAGCSGPRYARAKNIKRLRKDNHQSCCQQPALTKQIKRFHRISVPTGQKARKLDFPEMRCLKEEENQKLIFRRMNYLLHK